MNMYLYMFDNAVQEIIPEINPDLPGFPIEERYAPDFLKQCIVVSEEIFNLQGIEQGMVYNAETGEFAHPVVEEPVVEAPVVEEFAGNEADI